MGDIVFMLVGNLGTVCFLAAYFLLQKNKLKHDSYAYLGLNLGGAVCLLISLCWDWNMAAFLLELAWGIISAYGLLQAYRNKKPTPPNPL